MSFRVLKRRLLLLGLAAAVVCFVGTANAALLWYDGVSLNPPGDYTAGANNLGGQSGGAGTFFGQPWIQPHAPGWIVDHSVLGTSLERNVIHPTVGGKIGDTAVDLGWGNEIVGRNMHPFAVGWSGYDEPVGTFYMGFLASWGTASPWSTGGTLNHRAVEMYDSNVNDDTYRTLQLGYSEWTGLGRKLSLAVKSSDLVQHTVKLAENSDFWYDHGTTHFVVLKFDMQQTDYDPLTLGDNDVVSVYLDPVGLVQPAVPSAQISVDNFTATHMGAVTNFVWDGSRLATPAAFDELRVADTSLGGGFWEVANNTCPYVPGVPEPATVVLFGLGWLGLMGVARRK